MAVRKKGNKWYYRFMLDGVPYERSCKGATSQKEAEKFEAIVKADIMRGDLRLLEAKQKINFSRLVEIFLDYSKTNKTTSNLDEYFCNRFIDFFGKNKLINEIKPSDIEAYKAMRADSFVEMKRKNKDKEWIIVKTDTKIKPATINRELNSLSKMFNLAVDNGYIEKSPCLKLKKIKVENTKIRFLTKKEEKNLIVALKDHWLYPIVFTALKTGMRKAEILNLKWENVNYKKGYINVLVTKNDKPRQVPISPKLEELLKNIKKETEYVFINSTTKKPYSSITKSYNEVLNKAKINDFTFHDLRHTAATRMVEGGFDLVTVSEIFGWVNLEMVKRYAHTDFERKQKAIKHLDKY